MQLNEDIGQLAASQVVILAMSRFESEFPLAR